jgi:hypothetical protein
MTTATVTAQNSRTWTQDEADAVIELSSYVDLVEDSEYDERYDRYIFHLEDGRNAIVPKSGHLYITEPGY